jgi:hypothetical protein
LTLNVLATTHAKYERLAALHHRSIAAEADYLADKELLSLRPQRIRTKKPATPNRTDKGGRAD